MLNKWFLLFNTVKYLKIGQIFNRIKRHLIKPRVDLTTPPKLAVSSNNISPVVYCSQKMYGSSDFKFLNKAYSLRAKKDWNTTNQDKLWLYNLHYFDDLNAVNADQRVLWHNDLIQRWIDENPPGFGNGWEPYPLSLRIVNWIKWSLLNNGLKTPWQNSLAVQIRFLSQNLEYHLLGNHLFANAKALIVAGLYFQGPEADEWYQFGIGILNKELPEQILADGGNFELSPMYHAIFLEDLLDIINIHQVYKKKLPSNIISKVTQMFEWLKAMSHPDGEIAFFNDSALGIAPNLTKLLEYAKRLKLDIIHGDSQEKEAAYLEESGYFRINKGESAIIADVAEIGPSYIPGHGHADALSFELSLYGERVIVNSGISTYESGSDRNIQRGTQAHSTITIDDTNSSEVWGGFRVAKRAKVFNINIIKEDNDFKFSACHDGYKKLNGKVMHCREWSVSGNLLEVKDNITGSGKHKIASVLPLHPEVVVGNIRDNSVELEIKGKKIRISFKGKGSLLVKESHYHPEFGLLIENKQLIYNYNGDLPFKASISISW
jgi:uncharacterized heparinase superfamily protein